MRFWCQLTSILAPFSRSWGILGASWGVLEASWAVLGPSKSMLKGHQNLISFWMPLGTRFFRILIGPRAVLGPRRPSSWVGRQLTQTPRLSLLPSENRRVNLRRIRRTQRCGSNRARRACLSRQAAARFIPFRVPGRGRFRRTLSQYQYKNEFSFFFLFRFTVISADPLRVLDSTFVNGCTQIVIVSLCRKYLFLVIWNSRVWSWLGLVWALGLFL